MIDEREILKEIDNRINILNRSIERMLGSSDNEVDIRVLEREFRTLLEIKKLIKEESTEEITASQAVQNNIRQALYCKNTDHGYEFDEMLETSRMLSKCGRDQESKEVLISASHRAFARIIDGIMPESNVTIPYIIAALRVLADTLEKI